MSDIDQILKHIDLMQKQIEAIASLLNISHAIPQDEPTPDA
jgi:hypothetical protein